MNKNLGSLIGVWSVFLLLASCATPAPTPSVSLEGIIGTWREAQNFYLRLNQDGTFQYAGGTPANLDDQPWQTGRFSLDGERLTLSNSEESLLCAGEQWVVEAQLTEEGGLVFIGIEDSCEALSPNPIVRTNWQPVLP